METGLGLEFDRVRKNTRSTVNRRIDEQTAQNIRRFRGAPRVAIDERIRRLGDEWDIERVLETHAALIALGGLVLGATQSRRWYLLSGTVLGFLLLHGAQGWCPPLPVLRRLGIRTQSEIDRERLALLFLRGDFQGLLPPAREHRRLGALVEPEAQLPAE